MHSPRKANRYCCLFFKCYLFSVSAVVCFYACLTECRLLNFDSLIWKFHQRVTSQHTVNANELYIVCTPGIMPIQNGVTYMGLNCKGAEIIGNKQTKSLTNIHTDIQLYITTEVNRSHHTGFSVCSMFLIEFFLIEFLNQSVIEVTLPSYW